MTRIQHIKVTRAESGQKLICFLERFVEGQVPRSAIMRWIRTGQVRVDKSRCKPFARVKEGQDIRIPPYRKDESQLISSIKDDNPFLLRKVFEDENLLVLAKPSNLSTQPGSKQTDSVYDRIKKVYSSSTWTPALVHRLDKQVSGLLLVAKTYMYLQYLQNLWLENKINKIYLAWVSGHTSWTQWTKLKDKIYQKQNSKELKRNELRQVEALAEVKTIRNDKLKSLVAVLLHTGRKHQIRIQLSRRGHPIIGDQRYNGCGSTQGLMLHACHLSWQEHSFTLMPSWSNKYVVYSSDINKVWQK